MKKYRLCLGFFLFFFSVGGFSQTPFVKGLYVNGFDVILGDVQKEDSLLNYAASCDINYLVLYDLWPIHVAHNLTNLSSSALLANFIQKAKQNYNIQKVGAAGENVFFFSNVINPYNLIHTNPYQKIDVYNVEFEFWNVLPGDYYCTTYLTPGGYTCDTAGAFLYFKQVIHQVDSIANANGAISETYLGWFNQGQAVSIGNEIDRILLHDYISNYALRYSYIQQRLQFIAARNIITDVIPIFSAEPVFLGPWLSSNSPSQPFADLQINLNAETGTWKQYIHLAGYQWFAYSFMPDTIPIAVAGTDTTICLGDSVTLFSSGGTNYSWNPVTALTDSTAANPVASPSTTTVYTVTVSRKGCYSSASVTITVDSCNLNNINVLPDLQSPIVFPNPLTQTSEFNFEVNEDAHVRLFIIDLQGRVIKQLVNGMIRKGKYIQVIDANTLNSGFCFIYFDNGRKVECKKMLVVK